MSTLCGSTMSITATRSRSFSDAAPTNMERTSARRVTPSRGLARRLSATRLQPQRPTPQQPQHQRPKRRRKRRGISPTSTINSLFCKSRFLRNHHQPSNQQQKWLQDCSSLVHMPRHWIIKRTLHPYSVHAGSNHQWIATIGLPESDSPVALWSSLSPSSGSSWMPTLPQAAATAPNTNHSASSSTTTTTNAATTGFTPKVRYVQYEFASEKLARKFCKAYTPPKLHSNPYCELCVAEQQQQQQQQGGPSQSSSSSSSSSQTLFRRCRNCGVNCCDAHATKWGTRMLPKTYLASNQLASSSNHSYNNNNNTATSAAGGMEISATAMAAAGGTASHVTTMASSSHSTPTTSSIPNTNTSHVVRVCKACDWLSNAFCMSLLQGRYEDALQLYDTGNVNLRTSFADIQREAMFPVHCAVLGGSLPCVEWLVEKECCPILSSSVPPISVQTSASRTLLDLAMTGRPKLDILTHLLDKGLSLTHDVHDPVLVSKTLESILKKPVANNNSNSRSTTTHNNAAALVQSSLAHATTTSGGTSRSAAAVILNEENDQIVAVVDGADEPAVVHLIPNSGLDPNYNCNHDDDDGDDDTSNSSIENPCHICFEQTMDCVLTPCGHQVCCAECGSRLETCPVCKCPCSYLRIFRS